MSENDLVYKCAEAYQKGGIKAVIAEVREHDAVFNAYIAGENNDFEPGIRADERAKTIERVLAAGRDALSDKKLTIDQQHVLWIYEKAIKGVGDE